MSYFVFGRMSRLESPPSFGPTRFDVREVKRGETSVVAEMLAEQLGSSGGEFDFLVVSSRGENTSDTLVSPYALDDWEVSVSLTVRELQEWSLGMLRLAGTESQLHLFATEGYENAFKEIRCPVQQFASTFLATVIPENDIPSLHVVVTW